MDFHDLDLRGISIAFIAIPPSFKGQVSRNYVISFARRGIRMVSCEKSLFAYYPNYLDSVGHTAAVGGGSHLLPFLKEQVRARYDVIVHIILNATLNFIMSSEKNIDEATMEAVGLHFAEPEAGGCLVTINNEILDTALKTCIVANDCFLPECIVESKLALDPDDIKVDYLNEASLSRLEGQKRDRRYIVSFSRYKPNDDGKIGGFRFQTINGWRISAGFKRLDSDPLFAKLIIPGANNAVLVSNEKGGNPCYLVGPGAGPEPTAIAMIQDAKRIFGIC